LLLAIIEKPRLGRIAAGQPQRWLAGNERIAAAGEAQVAKKCIG
jgi:hypothetical protein